MAIVLNGFSGRVCVASTCSTSLVPMPNAIAPKAPWVDVCESPQTTVMPGWVRPSCGPTTCTMPCSLSPSECRRMPNSSALLRSVSIWMRLVGSAIGLSIASVGVLWSSVAIVRSGRRTGRPGHAQPVEGLRARDLVHEVQVDVDQVGRAVLALLHEMGVPDLLGQGERPRASARAVDGWCVHAFVFLRFCGSADDGLRDGDGLRTRPRRGTEAEVVERAPPQITPCRSSSRSTRRPSSPR